MSFESGRIPGRTYAGTGDRSIDISNFGLSGSPTYKLSDVLQAEFTVGDGTCYIDWATSTASTLEVKADPGTDWEMILHSRDHHGVVAGL